MELSIPTPGPNWVPFVAPEPECTARVSIVSNGGRKNRLRIRLSPAAVERMGLSTSTPVVLFRHQAEPRILLWNADGGRGTLFKDDRGSMIAVFPTDLPSHHGIDVEIHTASLEEHPTGRGLGVIDLPASFFTRQAAGSGRQNGHQRPQGPARAQAAVRPEVVVTDNVVGRQVAFSRPMLLSNEKSAGKEDPFVAKAITYLRETGDDVVEIGTFDGFRVNGNNARGADLIRRAKLRGMKVA